MLPTDREMADRFHLVTPRGQIGATPPVKGKMMDTDERLYQVGVRKVHPKTTTLTPQENGELNVCKCCPILHDHRDGI